MKASIKKVIVLFLAAAVVLAGCANPSAGPTSPSASNDPNAPAVTSTFPASLAASVGVDANITVTFSTEMKASSINATTFTVMDGLTSVDGVVSYSGSTAAFDPVVNLSRGKTYTAMITTGAVDLAGTALAENKTWTFSSAAGPSHVALGTAGNFAVLSKTGISTIPASVITGDIGVSPIAATGLTGFSLVVDAGGAFAISTQVVGKVYASSYAAPTPGMMTTAIGDMEIAYADADERLLPDFLNFNAGDLSGATLVPGLYNWTSGVMATTNVTLNGGPNDTWIFQVSGLLYMANDVHIILSGGAQAKNIIWKINSLTLGAGSVLEGIVLSKTSVTVGNACVINGRILAQTAVALSAAIVTQPTP
jgi:hypothetical protein